MSVTFLPGRPGEVRSATAVDDRPLVDHLFLVHGPTDPAGSVG